MHNNYVMIEQYSIRHAQSESDRHVLEYWTGHVNSFLAPGSGNLNNLIFKCSTPGGLPGKGELIGVLTFRIDRCISTCSLPQCTEQHLNTYTVAVSEEF